MTDTERKDFLDYKADQYNRPEFIETDPIQIPHLFTAKEDIEIAAFLTATIAWGRRPMILKNARKMMTLLWDSPADFIRNATPKDIAGIDKLVHRTFQSQDFKFFVSALQHIYRNHGGLETIFTTYSTPTSTQFAIHKFKHLFFEIDHPKRTEKHVSDPLKKSAAKRLNMFLRWMVRSDAKGVDFGLWTGIPPAALSCPLDVHSGRVARKLGLLKRSQNDARAVEELDGSLRDFDARDPVKYDFALFGLGVFEGF